MTEIKVGDTVRIKDNYRAYAEGKNKVGVEFKVSEVWGFVGLSPKNGDYYASGDPDKRGVWVSFLEKVEDPRWRYNDHIVVYPETRDQGYNYGSHTLGRGVTILDETPLPKIYTRWENGPEVEGDEITEAARAYWAAHPLPKPEWHSAKEGEVWIVTYEGFELPAIFQAGRFRDHGGGWGIDDITSARRIYPEQTA